MTSRLSARASTPLDWSLKVRITSEDRNTVLEIISNDPDDPFCDYTLRAIAKDGSSSFSGQNNGVHFSAFDQFLKRVADFIRTREGSAVLEMTEDCQLGFLRWNARGDVGLRARITKLALTPDSDRTHRDSVEIEFKIDSEFVNQMYEDFASMRSV
jgi:hypothetical protein